MQGSTRDPFEVIGIGPGTRLLVLPSSRFHTVLVKVALHVPLGSGATRTALLPFLLRRGSRQFPETPALLRHFEGLYGASFDADVTRLGDRQVVELSLDLVGPAYVPGREPLLAPALATLAGILFDPAIEEGAFRRDYFEQEREVLRRKLQAVVNEKRTYAAHRLREEMFRGTPLAFHRYGRLQDLPGLDPAELYRHYREALARYPLEVFASGAVCPEELARLLQDTLGEWVAGRTRVEALAPPGPWEPPAEGPPRDVVEHQPVQQAVLALGLTTGITYADPLYPALLLYNGVLGAFPHSKLFTQVRERASLAYFASSRLEAPTGVIRATAGVRPENAGRALAIIRQQLEDLAAGRVSDAELVATRRALADRVRAREDSPEALIDTRLLGQVMGRVWPPGELLASLEAVGREEIRQVAARVRLDTVFLLTAGGAP